MTTYTVKYKNGILEVAFSKDNPATGDIILQDAEKELDKLITRKVLKGGPLLKINGRISNIIATAFAHKLAHLYGAIAVSDTRLNAYVVVISNNPEYKIGDRLDFNTGKISTIPDTTPPAFSVKLEDDTLKLSFKHPNANGDQIVRETATQLEQLIESGSLKGRLLKINGRASVLASFVIGAKLAHLYGAIAVFDPKIGNKGLDEYVVTITHHPNYQIGNKIPIETQAQSKLKVALIGPPNTGKTCLREGLKKALAQYENLDYYLFLGCPDNDGAWHSETAQNNPELAKKLKEEYKAKFTPKFAKKKAREIEVIKNKLLVFDVGGKISDENRTILKEATHGIILVQKGGEKELKEWQDFSQELNLPVIAVIYSELEGTEDKIENDNFPNFTGTVHKLERGEDFATRPLIQKLAKALKEKASK